ncbi:EAL domain-containing protein, partial [Rhodoferax sp.]|uniref:putative bifunctional diguanylate cyclase/phosphodiesterase n=1 Tax=Rhodoferax sp. TaxID=50421 RepID=UPI00262A26BB
LDKARENALINTQRWRMAAFLLVLAFSVLLFMRQMLQRSLIAPLNRLMQHIRLIRQGNYAETALIATGDELEEIGHSINTLGQTVAQREAALEKARQEADYLSKHDVVTGLPNQRFMAERMAHALQLAHRNHSQLALLFLDLDQFKLVNDTLGHPVGDQLLAKIAERFGQAMRSSDTLARVGGDEFNILIENLPTPADLERVLAKYMALFATPFTCAEHQINITVSIGVALYPADGHDSVSLLKHADLAVYAAKEKGRNTYCYYTPDMSRLAGERVELIRDLKRAIDAGDQFEMYYQPKVSAHTGQVVSAEALIRWHKPGVGLVPPFKFIPLAEETRQIIAMGDWLIGQVCRDLVHFARLDVVLQHVSLNVSNVQLQGHDLKAVLAQALQQHQVQASQIELEITESYVAQDTPLAIESLHAFRAMGFALAIDDFGTGYSSLSYLKKLPFTRLKIDKSFVDGLPGDPDSEAIARAIIGLAKNFGLSVTAEGVERADQLAFLKREQCDEIQGYYYAKPMPVPEFVAFYRAHQVALLPA